MTTTRRLMLSQWVRRDPELRCRVTAINNAATRIREAHLLNGCEPFYSGGFWTYTRRELLAACDRIASASAVCGMTTTTTTNVAELRHALDQVIRAAEQLIEQAEQLELELEATTTEMEAQP